MTSGLTDAPMGERHPPALLGLDLAGRDVLVVGAGPIGERRVHAMLAVGARVHVVAPVATTELTTLSRIGRVALSLRAVRESDLDGVWLVQSCTDDLAVERSVAAWATVRRVFCVTAADASIGSARNAVSAPVADLVVGLVSDGPPDPRRAVRVRDALVAAVREGLVDLAPARPRTDPVGRGAPGSRATLAPGSVALVGGGPGAVDLLTLRARTLLAQADVVIADRLGPTGVLDELREDVEIVHVGKSPGIHQVPQERINELLVERARAGRRVVRLKGGDPYLYGRGGEELAACRAAGVPVLVVPGVTSVTAAPGAADVPVTHRGVARRLHVLDGHGGLTPHDVAALRAPEVTVVVLMGMERMERLVEQAAAGGVDLDQPAVAVMRATLPDERTVRSTLRDLPRACHEADVTSPAVLVIGAVAAAGLI